MLTLRAPLAILAEVAADKPTASGAEGALLAALASHAFDALAVLLGFRKTRKKGPVCFLKGFRC